METEEVVLRYREGDAALREWMTEGLTSRQRQILFWRLMPKVYGLLPPTLEDVGTKLDPPITRERVRQLEARSLAIMKKRMENFYG